MHIIGTAGHVDHGKSALVLALTGIDPDRLQEEKERGLTIDLGFAWLKLPSGEEISIVDVPGHERFIKNMLAGVGGIDVALLVVAADEGVMPQTREHLAILDLLQVQRGIVAITKQDLADEELLELVQEEVKEVLAGTVLAKAPLVATSAVTPEGLDELVALIDQMVGETPPRQDKGRPRLSIDRAFTISGFGTVVTGTLVDGELRVGQEMEIVPGGQRTRIRGLQSHGTRVEAIGPGTRTAANLVGVEPGEIYRGQTLTTPGWLRPTFAADIRLRVIPNSPSPVRHNRQVTFHSFAAETTGRVRLLDAQELKPGEEGWAQVRLDDPLPLLRGDFFIIRSTVGTLGGGQVVDAYAIRHRRHHAPTLERLEALAGGTASDVLLSSLEGARPLSLGEFLRRTGLGREQASAALDELRAAETLVVLDGGGGDPVLLSLAGWQRLADQAREALANYHRQFPLRRGVPKEELRSRLGLSLALFPHVLGRLVTEAVVEEEANTVHLPDRRATLSPAQQRQAEELLALLETNPYAPPSELPADGELVSYLAKEGKVVRVSQDVVFSAAAYREMVDRVTNHLRERDHITVAEVRDLFSTSRKYALALVEHLDQQRVTRRVGDERVLR